MRVALQFKKYGLSMFHMVAERMGDATGRPAEQARVRAQLAESGLAEADRTRLQAHLADLQQRGVEGRRMLTGLIAMHQLFSGALGLPFAGAGFAAADIVRGAFGDPEEKHDTRADFQDYLAHAFGVDTATAVARGLPAALLGVDLSRRVGMGDVMPFTYQVGQAIDSASGGNPNLAEKVLVPLLGPAGGIGEQVLKGYQKMASGDYMEGAATMMPRAVFNAYQGMKMAEKGVQVGGRPVSEPLNGVNALLATLGIPTTEVQRTKDAAFAAKEAATVFSDTRNRLIRDYAAARSGGEPVPDAVSAFNQRNPQSRISMSDVLRYQQTQKAGVKQVKGGTKGAQLAQIKAEAGAFGQEQ
jgi:hypothetical protein